MDITSHLNLKTNLSNYHHYFNILKIETENYIKSLNSLLGTKKKIPKEIMELNLQLINTSNQNLELVLKIIKKIELINSDNTITTTNFDESLIEDKLQKISNFVNNLDNITKENIHNFRELNLQLIPYIDEKITEKNLKREDLITSFLTLLNSANRNLNINLKSLTDFFNDLIITINAEVYDYSDFLTESYQRKFIQESELLLKRIDNESKKLFSGYQHEFKKLKSDHSQIFNSFETLKDNIQIIEDENKEIITEINGHKKRLDVIIERQELEIHSLLKDKLKNLEAICNEKIIEIDDSYKNAKKNYELFTNLVENAGIYKLTENYKTKADEEKKEYTTYRKHTTQAIIAAIVSTLAIFIIAFLEHLFSTTKTDTNFLLLASRLSISVMFFVLAFYLSKQAAKHYECYQENHRTFLQLAALEPFMARMSHDEQKEIRKGLIPSYFNQSADGKFAAKGDEVDMSMMFTFMDKLSNFAQIKKEQKPVETPVTETKP